MRRPLAQFIVDEIRWKFSKARSPFTSTLQVSELLARWYFYESLGRRSESEIDGVFTHTSAFTDGKPHTLRRHREDHFKWTPCTSATDVNQTLEVLELFIPNQKIEQPRKHRSLNNKNNIAHDDIMDWYKVSQQFSSHFDL